MHKPDLDQLWETFIRIGNPPDCINSGKHIETIRLNLVPMISRLKDGGIIDWWCFLIHDKDSGVPTNANDGNCYLHVRLELGKNAIPDEFLNVLPECCSMTRKVQGKWVKNIVGIDKTFLKNEDIREAWRIIGEQSEWLLGMLSIHKEDVSVPFLQIAQFLHYYSNMTGLQVG